MSTSFDEVVAYCKYIGVLSILVVHGKDLDYCLLRRWPQKLAGSTPCHPKYRGKPNSVHKESIETVRHFIYLGSLCLHSSVRLTSLYRQYCKVCL